MTVVDWIARRVAWPLWLRRDHLKLTAFAAELQRRQFDPPAVVAARQQVALARLLHHATRTVPFYAGRDPEKFADWPVLMKNDIRNHAGRLRSAAFAGQPLTAKKTSGSTGVPLVVHVDADAMAWKRAATLRSDEWSGWRRGEPIAKVWGNPEYRHFGFKGWLRNHLFERAIHLDTLELTDASLWKFARQLSRRPPGLLFGHAHSVYLVADFVRRHGISVRRPRGILTTAMILHDWQRRVIESAFDCPVTNRYGCEEVSLIACECERHRGLHVNAEGVYVEIVRDGRLAETGEAGDVVVTDLVSFAMPLIRYRVGDVATASDRVCECGRGLPLIESIQGRDADYVVTPNGQMVSGISLTENFATLVPGVAQIQIVQETVDRFVFRIVRGDDFGPASERRIGELVAERFGPSARFECEYVNTIPREASGKYRFCISRVNREPTARAA